MRKEIRRIKKAIKTIDRFNYILCEIVKGLINFINNLKLGIEKSKYIKHTGYTYVGLMNKIDSFTPRQFEIFCAELFKAKGYKAQITGVTNDYGRDIILKKDNKTYFVECKHYSKSSKIGREIVMKVLGSVAAFNVDGAIIVSTGDYNKNAFEIANMVDNLQLIGYPDIMNMLFNLSPIKVSDIISKIEAVA